MEGLQVGEKYREGVKECEQGRNVRERQTTKVEKMEQKLDREQDRNDRVRE